MKTEREDNWENANPEVKFIFQYKNRNLDNLDNANEEVK